ncbi:NAD(P)-dependent oxidoreductase [Sphingomonas sp. LHG3406-1]|uniref:NAD-dependent epimerase/dehydratase family protein n=1 Tax=Sphingomonas sp. LHG3406-1 TaxID=2804617 RepID=UPI002623A281|nr:NAD-dependent epimerase/dehydratase family protein [Sphingomonas sp. LHG3406-1]
MSETVLVTGGAGFIGRSVCTELLARGHKVRVLDSLIEQVHGEVDGSRLLPADVELLVWDVRNRDIVRKALQGADSVINLAAEVGVGQSMYEVERYTSGNDLGTAVLMEQLIERPVRRVVTASSMSIYGEGLYRDADGQFVQDAERSARAGQGQSWEPLDRQGRPLTPVPTPEWKRPDLASIYALGKYVQERTTLIIAGAYGMEGVCLRLFNVYGPGQALSNPYTGVLAIFSSRLLNDQRPVIFEDGEQRRDFVHVTDVARAFADALELPQAAGGVFNIGSGHDRSVREVGQALAKALGKDDLEPEIAGKGRIGDIRHCFCDGTLAADRLGFRAAKDFGEGLAELAEWVAGQTAVDRVEQARTELERRGLVG